MNDQKDQYLEEISFLHVNSSNFANIENKKDFLDNYQPSASSVEIHSPSFYIIQKAEMMILAIISCLVPITVKDKTSSILKVFNFILSAGYLAPSIFDYNSFFFENAYVIIGLILLLVLIFDFFTLLIGFKIKNDSLANQKILTLWFILVRLFLPLPGHILGYYLGYFMLKLTDTIYFGQISIIIFTITFWLWTKAICNTISYSNPSKKKSDICQINHNYISFHNFITSLPMIQAAISGITTAFSPLYGSYFYSFLISLVSISLSIYLCFCKPYNHNSMNKFVTFLLIIRIPLSFLWSIEQDFPYQFEYYCLFLLIFSVLAYFTIFKPFSSSHQPEFTQLNISKPAFNSSSNSTVIDEESGSTQTTIYDPTEKWPFPFNLLSLTKQDIILLVMIALSPILMVIANAIAAKRIPISESLPDIFHDTFKVSKKIRLTVHIPMYQISNVIIIVQFVLLFFIEFISQENLNVRRLCFIYSLLCFIRSFAFTITSLPAPCAGEANCPCADPKNIKDFKEGSTFDIALSWIIAFGIFIKLPQCGDLIISGHTMTIWIFNKVICEAYGSWLPRPFNWLLNSFFYSFCFVSMVYIIISKNHYSIDVWFGYLIPELLWFLYKSYQKLALLPPRPNDSIIVKLMRWIETRPPKRVLIETRRMAQEVMTN